MSTEEECRLPSLHEVTNADDLKYALLKGLNINERNCFGETPLLRALRKERSVELIEEFIKHGADVDAEDCWGVAPLYAAITKRGNDLKLIKLLIENGADIKRKLANDRALDGVIMHNRPCAKLIIKYKFLKNYRLLEYPLIYLDSNDNRDYFFEFKDVVDMNIKPHCYNFWGNYLDKCAADVHRMQSVHLCNGQTLLEFVSSKLSFQCLEAGNIKQVTNQIFSALNFYPYTVYRKMIVARIGRDFLLSKIEEQLSEMNIHSKQDESKVYLNFDFVYRVTKYLSDDDLLNFIVAHSVPT